MAAAATTASWARNNRRESAGAAGQLEEKRAHGNRIAMVTVAWLATVDRAKAHTCDVVKSAVVVGSSPDRYHGSCCYDSIVQRK
jgi:hypothetical protein